MRRVGTPRPGGARAGGGSGSGCDRGVLDRQRQRPDRCPPRRVAERQGRRPGLVRPRLVPDQRAGHLRARDLARQPEGDGRPAGHPPRQRRGLRRRREGLRRHGHRARVRLAGQPDRVRKIAVPGQPVQGGRQPEDALRRGGKGPLDVADRQQRRARDAALPDARHLARGARDDVRSPRRGAGRRDLHRAELLLRARRPEDHALGTDAARLPARQALPRLRHVPSGQGRRPRPRRRRAGGAARAVHPGGALLHDRTRSCDTTRRPGPTGGHCSTSGTTATSSPTSTTTGCRRSRRSTSGSSTRSARTSSRRRRR